VAKAKKTEAEVKLFNLSELAPRPGARKVRKRLGIGEGSGNGKTAVKDRRADQPSGFGLPAGFEGGQMPTLSPLAESWFYLAKEDAEFNEFPGDRS